MCLLSVECFETLRPFYIDSMEVLSLFYVDLFNIVFVGYIFPQESLATPIKIFLEFLN